jgi:hypothetical protein
MVELSYFYEIMVFVRRRTVMAIRNIRPRVLNAVHTLGTFTISELCAVAGLEDRNQAYAQLSYLKDFLECRTLPTGTDAHAPFKEYALKSDDKTLERFADLLAAYKMPSRAQTVSDMAEVALREADAGLNRLEAALRDIEHRLDNGSLNRLTALDPDFYSAQINIETARLEYSRVGGGRRALPKRVSGLLERWELADNQRKRLYEKLEGGPAAIDWAPMLKAFAELVVLHFPHDASVAPGAGVVPNLTGKFRGQFSEEYHAPIEVLLDEIRANREYPFEPVFRSALRTGNPQVLFDVVITFRHVDLPWWQYNLENTCYLKNSHFHAKRWLSAYGKLRNQLSVQKKGRFVVYSCVIENLTPEIYLDLAREQSVSLVSPRELRFLGASEVIRPTLAAGRGSALKSLDCAFLSPDDSFYAYGPIANDIILWQGAPELRVAACLGMWGLPLEENLSTIIKSLKSDRGLIVMQGEKTRLSRNIARRLTAEQLMENAAA